MESESLILWPLYLQTLQALFLSNGSLPLMFGDHVGLNGAGDNASKSPVAAPASLVAIILVLRAPLLRATCNQGTNDDEHTGTQYGYRGLAVSRQDQ